jgi:plastocyanin
MSLVRLSTIAAAVAACLVLSGSAAAAPVKVVGKVGPGYTISLSIAGKRVTKLKSGVTYRFVISDRSSDHDFRIAGPGVNKTLTQEEFTGTRTATLRLRKGSYTFWCAPHSDEMRGRFTVGA